MIITIVGGLHPFPLNDKDEFPVLTLSRGFVSECFFQQQL